VPLNGVALARAGQDAAHHAAGRCASSRLGGLSRVRCSCSRGSNAHGPQPVLGALHRITGTQPVVRGHNAGVTVGSGLKGSPKYPVSARRQTRHGPRSAPWKLEHHGEPLRWAHAASCCTRTSPQQRQPRIGRGKVLRRVHQFDFSPLTSSRSWRRSEHAKPKPAPTVAPAWLPALLRVSIRADRTR
jgi:hypothetical protein